MLACMETIAIATIVSIRPFTVRAPHVAQVADVLKDRPQWSSRQRRWNGIESSARGKHEDGCDNDHRIRTHVAALSAVVDAAHAGHSPHPGWETGLCCAYSADRGWQTRLLRLVDESVPYRL